MSLLNNPHWIGFSGAPITGKVPTQTIVHVEERGFQMTGPQYAEVQHAYKLFCDAVSVTPNPDGFHVQHRTFSDGTRTKMTSINSVHQVHVWPVGGGFKSIWIYPAFFYNAPALGSANPASVNSGTWAGIPYLSGKPLRKVDRSRRKHPGNRTWYDPRDTSDSYGLVLSWWGLSPDRYGLNFSRPAGTAQVFPEGESGMLFCNGVKIADFGVDVAIYGACMGMVDEALKIIAVTSPRYDLSSTPFTVAFDLHRYVNTDEYHPSPGGTVSLTTWHASIPSLFYKGKFSPITFSGVNSILLGAGGQEFKGPDELLYNYYTPPEAGSTECRIRSATGMQFNASGTEGIISVYGRAYGHPIDDYSDRTMVPCGIKFDPVTGNLTETTHWNQDDLVSISDAALNALFPVPVTFTPGNYSPMAADYEIDEYVEVLQLYAFAPDEDDVQVLQGVVVYHSKYGVLLPSKTFYSEARVTGDLRIGFTILVIKKVFGEAEDNFRVLTFLKDESFSTFGGDSLSDGIDDVLYGGDQMGCTGFEGSDSSYDQRLVVLRIDGETKVLVDGEDQTTEFPEPETVRYPVMCGPEANSSIRKKGYVLGDPP